MDLWVKILLHSVPKGQQWTSMLKSFKMVSMQDYQHYQIFIIHENITSNTSILCLNKISSQVYKVIFKGESAFNISKRLNEETKTYQEQGEAAKNTTISKTRSIGAIIKINKNKRMKQRYFFSFNILHFLLRPRWFCFYCLCWLKLNSHRLILRVFWMDVMHWLVLHWLQCINTDTQCKPLRSI